MYPRIYLQVCRLGVLIVFKHGQPALLYLVPGVLGALWLTGLVRGEVKDMWTYTEDGSIDVVDVVVGKEIGLESFFVEDEEVAAIGADTREWSLSWRYGRR